MEWTQEDKNRLTNLWESGLTAIKIAHIMGSGFTRCAVIGKANRLGLSKKPNQLEKRYKGAGEITVKTCQWPNGDTRSKDFHYCGESLAPPRLLNNGDYKRYPYCRAHCDIAYQKESKPSNSNENDQSKHATFSMPAETAETVTAPNQPPSRILKTP